MASTHSAQLGLNLSTKRRPGFSSWERHAGYSREAVLVSCIGVLLLMIAVTAFAARMYHKKVHVLGDQWFARGEAEFQSGNALEAAKDYRNALVYSESNTVFQFHLAQALTAANRPDTDEEAQSYLLNLLAESPGSGEINLELAHISARKKTKASIEDTQRYYFGAIYGVWQGDPLMKRWEARRGLCEYLLAHGMTPQAQPQTIALAQNTPPSNVARQKQAAALLMRAGLWDRALQEYRLILTSHRRDRDALAGEGMSAFHLAQYALAVQELDALPRSVREQPEIGAALAQSREVEAISPFLEHLSLRERAHRTTQALSRANLLLQKCLQQTAPAAPPVVPPAKAPAAASKDAQSAQAKSSASKTANATAAPSPQPSSPLAQLQASFAQNSRTWRELNLTRHPDQIEAAMAWVFHVESAVAHECGPSDNLMDRALFLIVKSRTGSEG